MDMFVIRGGRPLEGRVRVSGAKNAALPIMAAALAAEGPSVLHDVPDLVDVRTLSAVLASLGVRVERMPVVDRPCHVPVDGRPSPLRIETIDQAPCTADYDLVRRMRAGVCVLGPLLGRRGRACVSLPGGCNIGHRPIDLHLKGLRALGAEIHMERGYVFAEARRLRGAEIHLSGPFGSTVTGTCNVMSAAVFAEGRTIIEAAACEPEVVDLGRFLNAMGARMTGLGTPTLTIEGVERLHGTGHAIIPDRIEAATLMIAAAITGGRVQLDNVPSPQMTAVIDKLREVGVSVQIDGTTAEVAAAGPLRPADCLALPYPGIPTDVQAQLTALLLRAGGISVVTDKVFPDRFMHISEMLRMGAVIRREGGSAIVTGVDSLSGANVMASDLRAGAALVLAGLAATGETAVRRIYHLDRGYDRFEEKLRLLGADVRRIKEKDSEAERLV